jgi:hypothetical protein
MTFTKLELRCDLSACGSRLFPGAEIKLDQRVERSPGSFSRLLRFIGIGRVSFRAPFHRNAYASRERKRLQGRGIQAIGRLLPSRAGRLRRETVCWNYALFTGELPMRCTSQVAICLSRLSCSAARRPLPGTRGSNAHPGRWCAGAIASPGRHRDDPPSRRWA